MTVLAIDLAWSGKSGWVVWDADRPDPLVAYGEFSPIDKGKGARRTQHIGHQILAKVIGVLDGMEPPDVLAYEVTDWHQSITGTGEEQRKKFARERQVQRCLGRAEMALLLAAMQCGITPMEMGAKQVKTQFGAQRKDAIAHLLADEYPKRLEFLENVKGFLFDRKDGKLISHHISDAMAIAKIASDNLRQAKLNTHSE